jgi:hypothetical protein
MESYCERGNEPSGSIKCWESTEWLHSLWPLEWCSAPQSLVLFIVGFAVWNATPTLPVLQALHALCYVSEGCSIPFLRGY